MSTLFTISPVGKAECDALAMRAAEFDWDEIDWDADWPPAILRDAAFGYTVDVDASVARQQGAWH